ncbi:B-cell receptor-associated protein 31 [Habropoda laboriosa]|uniref:Endoplasmic reticulum transmembrane protein n=1 Tax=Habropoda laboriosa TaxID=597456 RepID=A0A0L7R1B6_9HYME|nr:PREDICTED: B-cell receptor-associated protein 31-like [Habropoda laboriosa]KOC64634.1 B-cell receptor-associated protein 31 [Habropoda laboriosa]
MTLQWTLIAGFLYAEIVIVLLLILPIISATRWQKVFKSRFLQGLGNQASFYFLVLLAVLVIFLLDAIREIRKYSTVGKYAAHAPLDSEVQGNMRLFRAQRNLYISGFALFLSFIIKRLVILISAQATLLAQSEAAMRQAYSLTTTVESLSQKTIGESTQNDSNEAHDKALLELKNQIKKLQIENKELEHQLTKEKEDLEAIKFQAQSLAKEYDRLTDEDLTESLKSSGDKKSD